MEPSLPQIGERFAGRYRILQELGHGGYGVVYKARQEAMGREVAIKILKPEAARKEDEVERFRREVFHASGLRHPNTITLHDFGESGGLFFIAMEFLEGVNLRDHLVADGPMDEETAMDVVEQLLKSLREAHAHGIVHRDLKPENIFLCDVAAGERFVKVLDFGLSKYVPGALDSGKEPSLTKDGVIFGTPHYMSPEQAYGQPVLPPSDVYGCGLLVYEMLTGDIAFNGRSSMEILIKQVSHPLPVLPEATQRTILADFMEICTRKEPAERFADAGEALQWLQERRNESSLVTIAKEPAAPQPIEEREQPEALEEPAQVESFASHPAPAHKTTLEQAREELSMRLAQLPLFGREAQLDALLDWSGDALHTGGVAAITGELGVGKTRLVDEWCQRMEMEGALVFRGRYREHGPALEGLRDALNHLYRNEPTTEQTLPVSLTPDILDMLRRVLEPGLDNLDAPDKGQDWRFVCVEQTVYSVARARPTILVLEDVHWADSFSLRLLTHWQEELATRTVPLILAFTSRSDEFGNTRRLQELSKLGQRSLSVSFVKELALERLDDSEARRLLQYLMPLGDEVVDAVIEQARGNPLYLTQIVQYMAEQDLLEYAGDGPGWRFVDGARAPGIVPPNLRTLLLRRIKTLVNDHALGAVLKALLARVMLIGNRFETRVLKDVLAREGRSDLEAYLDDALAVFARLGILAPTVIGGRPGLEFGYDVVRRALLDSEVGLGEDMPSLHRTMADVKAELYDAPGAQDTGGFAAEIAAHYGEAGDRRQSFEWLMRAVQRAEQAQDFRAALARSRDAEALLDDVFDQTGERLLEIRLAQGRLYRYLGEFGPAEFALQSAYEEAQRVGDLVGQAMSGEALAQVLILVARYDEAREMYECVGELFDRFPDPAGAVRCQLGQAEIARFRGNYPTAEAKFRTALDRARAEHDADVEIRALYGLGQCAYAAGRLTSAAQLFERGRKRAEVAGDLRMMSQIDIELALLAIHTRGIKRAETLARAALETKKSLGDTLGVASAHLVLGLSLRRSTRLAEAQFHAERALALNERLNHTYGIAKAVLLQAEICWMKGQLEHAAARAAEAEKLHADLHDMHGLALSKIFRGLFECEAGRVEKAKELLSDAFAIGGKQGLGLYHPNCLLFMGLVFEGEGNVEEAIAYYGEALQVAEASGNREIASITASALAKMHVVVGDIEAVREDIAVARSQAELLGNKVALVFALACQVLLARMIQDTQMLQESMQKLRVLHDNRSGANLRIPERILGIGELLVARQPPARAARYGAGLVEILEALGSDELAASLRSKLPRVAAPDAT